MVMYLLSFYTAYLNDEIALIPRSLTGNCPLMASPFPIHSTTFVPNHHHEHCVRVLGSNTTHLRHLIRDVRRGAPRKELLTLRKNG